MRVCLNIEIITQNYEIPLVANRRVSVVSSDFQVGTNSVLNITLDKFQVDKYEEFLSLIEWLIRDEIVSISHNSFAIAPSTLKMVIEHIKKTGKTDTSFHDKLELKFIVDSDQKCIQSFKNMLRKLKFSNFQLCELGNFFYVIHCSVQESVSLLFTSTQIDSLDENVNRLVFNEDYFTDIQNGMSI